MTVIGVTGTNGKTSTVALLQAAFTNAGRDTIAWMNGWTGIGWYRNNAPIEVDDRHVNRREYWNVLVPTFDADVAVIEMPGQGLRAGQFPLDIGVITNVFADHLIEIGPTVEDVARHKADILSQARIVFLGPLREDLAQLVASRIPTRSVAITHWDQPLVGDHQDINASLAAAVLAECNTAASFAGAHLTGRLEYVRPDLLVDMCKNAESADVLVQHRAGTIAPVYFTVRHRHLMAVANRLAVVASQFYLVNTPLARWTNNDRRQLQKIRPTTVVETIGSGIVAGYLPK